MKTIWNRIIYVMLLLAVLSTFFVVLTTARYRSSVTASDTATVAKFDVQVTPAQGQLNSLSISGAEKTATYVFTVTNYSEVTVNYDVIVQLSKPLPKGVSMTLTDGTTVTPIPTLTPIPTPDSGTNTYTYTFPSIGALKYKAANEVASSKDHTLTFYIEDNTTITAQTISDISISVKAYQVI